MERTPPWRISQRRYQLRIFGEVAAVGVEDRYALRQNIGDDSIAGFADDRVGCAEQVLVVSLGCRQGKEIALASMACSGHDKKVFPLPCQLVPR